MADFIIVTDATCDLTKEYMQQNNVVCLPMLYSVDGTDYYMMSGKDDDGLDMREFYSKMRAGSVTKTSQVNKEEAVEKLRPLLQSGNDVLYLGFSSALSGTAERVISALQDLQKEFPERTALGIDSLCASMGEGLFVHYAVTMKKEGKSINEIYDFLKGHIQNFIHYFTVDDLHHLHRGGRVSKLTAIVGSLLGIKPVLHVSPDGRLIKIGTARGRQKALKILVDKMKNNIENANQPVFISHGDCYDDAKFVADMITEQIGIKDITINFIGPVVGSHSGPGTIALFFMGKERN